MKFEVRDITFSYGNSPVLDHVSYLFQENACTAIMGNNGCGKTTLLKCIIHPDSKMANQILIDSVPISQMNPRDISKKIAFVPQRVGLPELSVYDYIMLGRIPYFNVNPSIKDKEAVLSIIKELSLDPFIYRNINELSGGEQQKICIARALAQQPQILLLDEPTNNLDFKNQIEISYLLKQMTKKGLTVIVTLHDLNYALELSDQFVFIKDCKIYKSGAKEIITNQLIHDIYHVNTEVIEYNNKKIIIPKENL